MFRVVVGSLICSAAFASGMASSDAAKKTSTAEASAPMVDPLVCGDAVYYLDGVPNGNSWHLAPGQAYDMYNVRYAISDSGAVVAESPGWSDRDVTACTWVTPTGRTWYIKGVLK
jgi:hypothetical protein